MPAQPLLSTGSSLFPLRLVLLDGFGSGEYVRSRTTLSNAFHFRESFRMINGPEMHYGDLSEDDVKTVRRTLQPFIDALIEVYSQFGLTQGQIPFLRPANFTALLTDTQLIVVADVGPASGFPTHYYVNARGRIVQNPIEEAIVATVRDAGYQKPIGVILPVLYDGIDEGHKLAIRQEMKARALMLCQQILQFARIGQLIPPGFGRFANALHVFIQDHPNPDRNAFLMMRFRKEEQYQAIQKTLRNQLAKHGFEVLRADDKAYMSGLWDNVVLHMLGCRYGIAVFEEIDVREFNPSVAIELGCMI